MIIKWDEIKRKFARKCLEDMLREKDPAIYKDLAIAAHVIAQGHIMAFFDGQRINHCKHCISRDQLIEFLSAYYCIKHLPEESPKSPKLKIVRN